jgi:hypothetical protein
MAFSRVTTSLALTSAATAADASMMPEGLLIPFRIGIIGDRTSSVEIVCGVCGQRCSLTYSPILEEKTCGSLSTSLPLIAVFLAFS